MIGCRWKDKKNQYLRVENSGGISSKKTGMERTTIGDQGSISGCNAVEEEEEDDDDDDEGEEEEEEKEENIYLTISDLRFYKCFSSI